MPTQPFQDAPGAIVRNRNTLALQTSTNLRETRYNSSFFADPLGGAS